MPLSTAGSLGPAFATARPVGLAVKHPSTLTLYRMIANHAEGTFELLRYNLGGNRPSQTDPLSRSSPRIHGNGLDVQILKGGISLVASLMPDDTRSRAPTYSTHERPNANDRLQ